MPKISMMRVYDDAMRDFVRNRMRNTVTDFDEKDTVVHATPDRPYGFVIPKDKKGNVDTKRMEMQLSRPRVSITRGDEVFDWSRNNSNQVRTMQFWDGNKDFRLTSKAIKPWNIQYTIGVIARLREEAQDAVEWWLFHAGSPLVTEIDFGYPWGKRGITYRFDAVRDVTVYDPEEEIRYYQFLIPCIVEAYAFESFNNPGDIPQYGTNSDLITSRRRTVKRVDLRFVECSFPDDPLLVVTLPVVPPVREQKDDFC